MARRRILASICSLGRTIVLVYDKPVGLIAQALHLDGWVRKASIRTISNAKDEWRPCPRCSTQGPVWHIMVGCPFEENR